MISDEDRHVEVEALREDRRLVGAGERPREAREARAQGERQQLAGDGVDAHRRGGRLVLADGHPGATELGVAEPRADDEGQGQQGRHEVNDAIAFWFEKMICSPHGPGIGMMGGSIGLMPTLPPVRFACGPTDGAAGDGRRAN